MAALNLIITDAGRRALVNAAGDGTNAVRIVSCGISATSFAAGRGTIALQGEIKRLGTISGQAISADVMHLVVRDESAATYTLRSFALYLGDGTLFAVYSQADPILEKSAQALMLLAVDVTLVDVAATSVTFGDANFLSPPATTERVGVVELATDAEAAALADPMRALTPKGAAAIFTAANVLSRLLSVDGAGSGLDADLVRGRAIPEYTWLSQSSIPVTTVDADTIPVGGSAFTTGPNLPGGTSSIHHVATLGGGDINTRGFQVASSITGSELWVRTRPNGWVRLWSPTNDGAGSGLDADLLDGRQGSDHMGIGMATERWWSSSDLTLRFRFGQGATTYLAGAGPTPIEFRNADGFQLAAFGTAGGFSVAGAISSAGSPVWTSGNDGAGSGLDADLLDGRQGSEYALLAGSTFSGPVHIANQDGLVLRQAAPIQLFLNPAGTIRFGYIQHAGAGGAMSIVNDQAGVISLNTGGQAVVAVGPAGASVTGTLNVSGAVTRAGNAVWDAGNDGAGSGLDADLLDGRQGSDHMGIGMGTDRWWSSSDLTLRFRFGQGATTYLAGAGPTPIEFRNSDGFQLATFGATGGMSVAGGISAAGNPVWTSGNDGAGSGLDADLLDGRQGSEYALLAGSTFTGPVHIANQDGLVLRQAAPIQLFLNPAGTIRFGYIQHAGAGGAMSIVNDQAGVISLNTGGQAVVTAAPAGATIAGSLNVSGGIARAGSTVWDAGNDGSGSGLDADFLDGRHASEFMLADALGAATLSENGYQILPGGLILQWCTGYSNPAGSEPTQVLTFPISFPNRCLNAQVSTILASASNRTDAFYQIVGSVMPSGVTVQRQGVPNGSDERATTPMIFAIGF